MEPLLRELEIENQAKRSEIARLRRRLGDVSLGLPDPETPQPEATNPPAPEPGRPEEGDGHGAG